MGSFTVAGPGGAQHVRREGVGERIREWVTRGSSVGDGPETDPEPPYFQIDGWAILGNLEVKGR